MVSIDGGDVHGDPVSSLAGGALACQPDGGLVHSHSVGPHGESVLIVVGEIDLCSNAALATALNDTLDQQHSPDVVVDLRGVWFLSACGIATLVAFQQRVTADGGRLIVVADSRPTLRVLRLTGTDRMLDVRPHVSAAHR